jgi:hypothetical protein
VRFPPATRPNNLNTLLTALYVLVDDQIVAPRTGRGHRPDLTDSELICLAVAQIMLGYHNERRWVRHVHATPELLGMFPTMLSQSGYHRRLKSAQPVLCKAILTLAACCPSWFDDLWITDATPVPCGMSRETVKRSDLAGHANYGYCASHSRWYWGLKLYLVCAGDGMPVMWCLADPKIGEREVLSALLDNNHHLIREGQVMLADKGFSGKGFKKLTESKACGYDVRTARTRPTATATSVGYANGSNRSIKPSKDSSIWNGTADALRTACSPGSRSACWPWPPVSGTTG